MTKKGKYSHKIEPKTIFSFQKLHLKMDEILAIFTDFLGKFLVDQRAKFSGESTTLDVSRRTKNR